MNTKDYARVHRFRDAVALSIGDLETQYITSDHALALAATMRTAAIDCQKNEFTASKFSAHNVVNGSVTREKDGLRREWVNMENLYAPEPLLTVMCLWEFVLADLGTRGPSPYGDFLSQNGTAGLRERIASFAPSCDAAYAYAVQLGYDDAFDWEFVPRFMSLCITEGLEVRENWRGMIEQLCQSPGSKPSREQRDYPITNGDFRIYPTKTEDGEVQPNISEDGTHYTPEGATAFSVYRREGDLWLWVCDFAPHLENEALIAFDLMAGSAQIKKA